METLRPCSCKGIRSCLLCESRYNIAKQDLKARLEKYPSYVYCPRCNTCWPGWDADLYKTHPDHQGEGIDFPGVYIELDFLSSQETTGLLRSLDSLAWEPSQSGRRKQNFGPKCNFKRRRMRLGEFEGFPAATRFVQEKFSDVAVLKGFRTVEQCTLEYDPARGASIDPHIDDCWIWGERIVTVNVLGDSVLTMTPYAGPTTKYNLEHVAEYSPEMFKRLFPEENRRKRELDSGEEDVVVRLPMPQGSLVVLYGAARYAWEHSVLREDVKSRRVCVAYREFTPSCLKSTSTNSGGVHEILQKASIFIS